MAPAGGGDAHSCAWPEMGSSHQLDAWPRWLRSALLCLAGVTVHEPGGQRGCYGAFSWLVGLTLCDSERRWYCENLVSLGPGLP